MDSKTTPSPLFDGIANWLIREGLSDAALPDIIRGFGQRLISGGVPIHRIGVGGMLLIRSSGRSTLSGTPRPTS